jgi:hypothetical protein
MTRISSTSRRIVCAAIVACAALTRDRDAHACGRGMAYGPTGDDLLLLAGISVVGTADVVFTAHDAARAGVSEVHDTGWSKAEIYLTTPQLAIGGALAAYLGKDADVAFAFTAWPASLMVHGFYTTNGTYGERWALPVGALGAMDVGLVGYWSIATLSGHRPNPAFGAGEFFTGLAQACFGLAFAAQSSGTATRDSLLMTLVPAALVVHGYFVASHETSSASASASRKKKNDVNDVSFFPSMFVQSPSGPVVGLSLAGAF